MLIGDPPHMGRNAQSVIARILTEPPRHVRAVRASVPEHVDAAIDRALAKMPADRFASAHDFADALGLRDGAMAASANRARRSLRGWLREPVRVAIAIIAVVGVGSAIWFVARGRPVISSKPATFVISSLTDSPREGAPTITPDGQNIVYVGSSDMKHAILVRRIDESSAHPLPGTEGALYAFPSPDGRRIGFITQDDRLKIVPITGGPPVTIAKVLRYTFAQWGRDSTIIFDAYGSTGLAWLADSGGTPTMLTRVDFSRGESRHSAPLLLNDGKSILFTIVYRRGGPGTLIGDLAIAHYDTRATQPARHRSIGVSGRQAVALVDDWLLYVANDGASIQAVRFDGVKGIVTNTPVPVLQDTVGGIEGVALSNNGTLLYTRRKGYNTPMLVDADGAERPLLGSTSGSFMNPRLSPDGQRVAIQAASPRGNDVLVYDLASHTPTHLTATGSAQLPSWTPDGQRVVYWSQEDGGAFWWIRADGSSPAEKILPVANGLYGNVTGDGRTFVFERTLNGTWSIWAASLDGDRTPRQLMQGKTDSYMPAVSPDGKWLAFASNVSGRYEVYILPVSGVGAPVQVSDAGGVEPMWAGDGRRLFYRGDRQFVSVALAFAPRLTVSERRVLFRDAFEGDMPHADYDVTRDGKHFVTVAPGSAAAPETVVILNWLPQLRAKLSAAH
jgi:serine/threonine-protein kinase